MPPIYLDYNATTPIDPSVVAAMEPYLRDHFGNPSSDHDYGYRARDALSAARQQLAALAGATADEVVFTGGGSEANNLALKGIAYAYGSRGKHIITTAIEHPSIAGPLHFLQRHGYEITVLPVDRAGQVDPGTVERALRDETILVSVMHANNEVGTLQPIRAIAQLAHRRGALMHTDAAQTVGKVPLSMQELEVDLLTVAGHKLYAPKGVGALIVRGAIQLEPLIHGAGHEAGRRAGTENIPYLVGLGQAAARAQERLPRYQEHTRALRDLLQAKLLEYVPAAQLNGHPTQRLPNTLNLGFPGLDAAALLRAIQDRVACSTGSACHAGQAEPSAVLQAMGQDAALASAALRLSLGWHTTEQEILAAAQVLGEAARSLRDGAS